jgi:hypothetical protein
MDPEAVAVVIIMRLWGVIFLEIIGDAAAFFTSITGSMENKGF